MVAGRPESLLVTSDSSKPLVMMTGSSGQRSRRTSIVSAPPLTGIIMSRRTRSTWRSSRTSSACAPSGAVTVWNPRRSSIWAATRRTGSSSSTTRAVPRPIQLAVTSLSLTDTAARSHAGKKSSKVVPAPGADSTRIAPACERMIPWIADMPRPRPLVFVVKKGSKTWASTSSVIPQPVSRTSSFTNAPGTTFSALNAPARESGSCVSTEVRIWIVPASSPKASEAF